MQGYVTKHRDSFPKPNGYNALVARAALESLIIIKFRNNGLSKDEEVEQLQGLTNAIFMEEASINKKNKCKIVFSDGNQPETLTNMSSDIEFAFGKVTHELAIKFAKLCCETDESGNLLKDEKGNYLFSVLKFNGIVEKYYKDDLGDISPRERAINQYTQKIELILKKTELQSLHYDKPEVQLHLDFETQQQVLREKLLAVSDREVKNVANAYFDSQKTAIEATVKRVENSVNSTTDSEDNTIEKFTKPINQNNKRVSEKKTASARKRTRLNSI